MHNLCSHYCNPVTMLAFRGGVYDTVESHMTPIHMFLPPVYM